MLATNSSGLGEQREGLRVGDVPVEDVELVERHRVEHRRDGLDRQVVPRRVDADRVVQMHSDGRLKVLAGRHCAAKFYRFASSLLARRCHYLQFRYQLISGFLLLF